VVGSEKPSGGHVWKLPLRNQRAKADATVDVALERGMINVCEKIVLEGLAVWALMLVVEFMLLG
jgi:hypothetical protein